MALDQTPEKQPAESAGQPLSSPRPEPIDLEQDPFGTSMGEGEQSAGLGSAILKLFARGKKGPGAPKPDPAQATAPGAPDAPVEPGKAMESAEPAIEGKLQGPKVQLGTTRPLANLNYFDSQDTQLVLAKLQKHGVTPQPQSWASTEAQTLSVDVARLTGRAPSLNWSPGDVLQMRKLLDSQGKSVKEMGDMLNSKMTEGAELSAEELAEFELRSTQLVATQNAVAGLSTEAGRLLNSLQIRVDTPESVWREMAATVERGGGNESVKAKIRNVATASAPGQVQRAVQDGALNKTWRFLLQLRYNMMLSSVRTHGANVAGSGMVSAYEAAVIDPLAHVNNLILSSGSKAMSWAGLPVPVEQALPPASEFGAWRAAARGTISGLKVARDIAKGVADPNVYGGKYANEIGVRYKPGEGWGQGSQSAGVRAAGAIASTPTRLLEAEDALFRSLNYTKRLEQLAFDRAYAEAGSDVPRRDALHAQYLTAPPTDMGQAAKEYGQKLTYTNDPSIYGKLIGSLYKAGNGLTQFPPFKLIIPFVRTPANLLGYTGEQITGGALSPMKLTDDLLGDDPRLRADALARVEMAVGMAGLLYTQWEQDKFTGQGSANWNTVRVMESQGWKPNAVMTEDGYVTLNRLDPMGATLGAFATAFELSQELGDKDTMFVMMGTLLSTADMMQDRAFLSGFTDMLIALDRGKSGVGALGNLVASTAQSMVVPNITRDFRNISDQKRRSLRVDYEAEGVLPGVWQRLRKSIKNALPIASETLPPAVDWKGDFILNNAHPLVRGFVPVEFTEKEFDLPSSEILRNNVAPNTVDHRIGVPGSAGVIKVNLLTIDPNGILYAAYQQRVGQRRHELVEQVIESRGYRKAVEEGLSGHKESAAARALSTALSKAQSAEAMRLLEDLATPGTVFSVGEQSYTVPPEVAHGLDVREAVKSYRKHREQLDNQGLQYREKDAPAMPEWMAPDLRF